MNSAGTYHTLSGTQDADTLARAQESPAAVRARRACVALSAVPILICAALAYRYAFDAPYWDQWTYVRPIANAFEGTLTPADFWVRNNEHILFVSSLIVIPLARLTHWDIRYEIGLTILSFAAAFGLLAVVASRGARRPDLYGSLWALPLIAVMMFSPSQYAIWSWGLHLCIGLAVFFIVATLVVLARPQPGWLSLAGAVALALAATFSVGAGVAVWPAGAIAIVLWWEMERRRRLRFLAAWLAAGVATSIGYLLSRGDVPEYAANAHVGWLDYPVYLLAYLGGPLVPYSGQLAFVCGIGFVLLAGVWAASRVKTDTDRFDAFVLGLMSVGVTVGVLTSLKHAHEGPANAVSSRFLPWPTLSWSALTIAWYRTNPRLRSVSWREPFAAILIFVVMMFGWVFGAYKMDERYDAFASGRRALLGEPPSENLAYLHPRWRELRDLREVLAEHRLTVFRE